MRSVKVGIIGCGVISHTYAKNIIEMFPKLEVVACADLHQEKAQALSEKFSIKKACLPQELLMDDQIEIIINLTLPVVHDQVNRQILMAGKHVYCEKPLALDLKEAELTLALAKEKGLMLACAPETVLGAGMQTARKLIDDGWIGRPIGATANMISHGPETWHGSPEFYYKKGAGPMMDMGPYYISALIFLLGPIRQLACFSETGRKKRRIYSDPLRGQSIDVEVATTYMGVLQFENGAAANMTMTFDVYQSGLPKLEIYGTQGTLSLPDPNNFGGKIKLFRGERVIDAMNALRFGGSSAEPSTKYEDLQEIPQLYEQPLEYMRGLGVLDMAHALINGRRHRLNEAFSLHMTEALLGMENSALGAGVVKMETTCERPLPMPRGLAWGDLD